jgi:hypothetical protein
MARDTRLESKDELETFQEVLFRAIQSSHINFLLGAGASCPGVPPAGQVESDILELLKADKGLEADKKTIQFLKQFKQPMSELLGEKRSENVATSLKHYADFIQTIDALLSERKTNLLPRQASIFTTNYDLFIECASEQSPSILLNDGFNRVPSLKNLHKFAPERLFDATHHTGNHYDYTAELPSINLIKLHGSMTWERQGNDVVYRLMDFKKLSETKDDDTKAVATALQSAAIVLPTQRKFQQTIIERTYYDLLRIFANVMERENSLLIAFGFSFRDEHILEIVKRALRNPTLKLIICCYALEEVEELQQRFASYNNASLLIPEATGKLDFPRLNSLLRAIAPPKVSV